MPAPSRTWEFDWAGPHGTAWGTVNACLSTITAAVGIHETERHWPLPPIAAIGAAVGIVVVGIIYTLLRAAVGKPQQGATVAYKLLCWLGVGVWLVVTLHRYSWTGRSVLAHVVVLAVAAIIAGLAAGLAADAPPKPVEAAPPAAAPAPAVSADPVQAERDKLAVEWEKRIHEYCDGEGYTVPSVHIWPRGNGYSVEAHAPGTGGLDFTSIISHINDFAADLNLVFGGAIKGEMGMSRRIAVLDVTTLDILAADTDYEARRSVHSIRDDLAVGHKDDGNRTGPNLWQNCFMLSGESGSGKTNAGHVLTAEIVTTGDALLWMWELTGGGLWSAWMDDWLHDVYDTPPVDWCAFDDRELLWQSRAAVRVGYARKPGYKRLMLDADDDKLPVSADVPEIVITGDEIARVTGNMSEHDEAKECLRLVCFELRAAAVRAVFLGLRGTDDVISSGIQSQCQARGIMKVNTKAEAGWALGPGHDFGPEDTPYPGSGGLVPGSGEPVHRVKWDRMKPSIIRVVARLGSTRRPVLDELSRRAANGRNFDGTPMDDLYPGELDCYDTRWARFRAWSAANGSTRQPTHVPAATRAAQTKPTGGSMTPEEAKAGIDTAFAAIDARIAELDAMSPDTLREESDRLLGTVEGLAEMAAEGFGDDWVADESVVETPPKPTDEPTMLRLIREAGPKGIRPHDLLGEMGQAGVFVSKATLHKYLNKAKAAGQVHQPFYGKWAIGAKKS